MGPDRFVGLSTSIPIDTGPFDDVDILVLPRYGGNESLLPENGDITAKEGKCLDSEGNIPPAPPPLPAADMLRSNGGFAPVLFSSGFAELYSLVRFDDPPKVEQVLLLAGEIAVDDDELFPSTPDGSAPPSLSPLPDLGNSLDGESG
jgi:hypothetical protein